MPRTRDIIAAQERLSTNFATMASFDAEEATVSASLPRPETGLADAILRSNRAPAKALLAKGY
jgi:hypothetical protein